MFFRKRSDDSISGLKNLITVIVFFVLFINILKIEPLIENISCSHYICNANRIYWGYKTQEKVQIAGKLQVVHYDGNEGYENKTPGFYRIEPIVRMPYYIRWFAENDVKRLKKGNSNLIRFNWIKLLLLGLIIYNVIRLINFLFVPTDYSKMK